MIHRRYGENGVILSLEAGDYITGEIFTVAGGD